MLCYSGICCCILELHHQTPLCRKSFDTQFDFTLSGWCAGQASRLIGQAGWLVNHGGRGSADQGASSAQNSGSGEHSQTGPTNNAARNSEQGKKGLQETSSGVYIVNKNLKSFPYLIFKKNLKKKVLKLLYPFSKNKSFCSPLWALDFFFLLFFRKIHSFLFWIIIKTF